MAESISTPTKFSARNPVCRLCGGSYESHYMLQIFSKTGSTKDLCSTVKKKHVGSKFLRTIRGQRYLSRKSGSVYSKGSISRQYTVWSKLRIFCKVMRSTFAVFPSAFEVFTKDMPPESSDVDQLSKQITSGRSAKQLSFWTLPTTTADNSTCTTTSRKHPKRTKSISAFFLKCKWLEDIRRMCQNYCWANCSWVLSQI